LDAAFLKVAFESRPVHQFYFFNFPAHHLLVIFDFCVFYETFLKFLLHAFNQVYLFIQIDFPNIFYIHLQTISLFNNSIKYKLFS